MFKNLWLINDLKRQDYKKFVTKKIPVMNSQGFF